MEPTKISHPAVGKPFTEFLKLKPFESIGTGVCVGQSTQIGSICLAYSESAVIVITNPRWYTGEKALLILKGGQSITELSVENSADYETLLSSHSVQKAEFYSALLGMIEFEGEKYLVLVEEALIPMFYDQEAIMQITKLKTLKLSDFQEDQEMASHLSNAIGQNGYFSFHKNITQRLTAAKAKQKYNHQMFWAGASFQEILTRAGVSKAWDIHFTLGSFEQISVRHQSNVVKVLFAARKSVLDSSKLPFSYGSNLLGDNINFVIHEIIVEIGEQKWMLSYTSSSPVMFRDQDIQPDVNIPRDIEKVCQEVSGHIKYTNNTHSGTNWWFVISDKKHDTEEIIRQVTEIALETNSGSNKEVYDVPLSELQKEVKVRPITFSGAVHSIYEILGPTNVVDLCKFPSALDKGKDLLDNHLHFLLLQSKPRGNLEIHLLMLFALLLRSFGISDFDDPQSMERVKELITSMHSKVYNIPEEEAAKLSTEENPDQTEVLEGSYLDYSKTTLDDVFGTIALERTTASSAESLNQAKLDQNSFEESSLSVLVFTWDVRGYAPEDPLLMKDFLKAFDKNNLPGLVSISLQSVINTSGIRGAFGALKDETKYLENWTSIFSTLIGMVDSGYALDSREMMVGLLTMNFVHKCLGNKVTKSYIHELKSSMMGLLGTKGSLITSFCFKDKLINIANTHLPGGDNHEKREKRLTELINTYAHCKKGPDALILAGDFNFKLFSKGPLKADLKGKCPGDPGTFWEDWKIYDELCTRLHPGLKQKFQEAPVTFPSTVGLDPKAQKLVYAAESVPAWPDRVFVWNSRRHDVKVEINNYKTLEIRGSTHLPVVASVTLKYKEFNHQLAQQKLKVGEVEDLSEITPEQIVHVFNKVLAQANQTELLTTLMGQSQ